MILEKKIRLWYDWGSFFSQITDPDLIWDHFLWRSDQNTRSFCHCLKRQTLNFFSEFICTKIIINVRNIKGVLMKLWFHIMKSESTKKHKYIIWFYLDNDWQNDHRFDHFFCTKWLWSDQGSWKKWLCHTLYNVHHT